MRVPDASVDKLLRGFTVVEGFLGGAELAATPRQRARFGFPDPGDVYWDEQTLADVATRYPGMDMTPYEQAYRRGR